METKEIPKQKSIENLFSDLLLEEPKPIASFVPANGAEQMELFLSGEVVNPVHDYERLDTLDFAGRQAEIDRISTAILNHPDTNPKFQLVYEQFVAGYLARTKHMELARSYNHAEGREKEELGVEYMRQNIEIYGEPEESTYRAILKKQLDQVRYKDLSGQADEIRVELLKLLSEIDIDSEISEYRPKSETLAWAKRVSEELYGDFMKSIPPDKQSFGPSDIQEVFQDILKNRMGGATDDWSVLVEKAQSINVRASEKKIVIPDSRAPINVEQLRSLIVHEIGVHTLRAIDGAETNLPVMEVGLSGYYDAEEGLGVLMEQALQGEYQPRGEGHYLTAGLAYFDGQDFRGTYEVKWRLALLEKLKDGASDVSQDEIEKVQVAQYKNTMRIFRGTDDLPWFKDLAYYNGLASQWKYLDEICGDAEQFVYFVTVGKIDPSNPAHRRVALEVGQQMEVVSR